MATAFSTVAQAIAEVGALFPHHGFVFQDLRGEETSYDFPDLERETARRAGALQALGVTKGDRIGLVVIEPEDFVLTFLASLRIGVVPVPLYPPMSFGNLDAYAERTGRVLANAGARLLVASERLQNVLWSLVDTVPSLERLVLVEGLVQGDTTPDYPEIEPEDLAFLQYTSGSTADPKGVMVTHGSLVANSKGIICEGLQLDPHKGDKGISWLPLYHDMGLIGFVIAPICHGVPVVFIPTLRFIKRPSVWLDTVHRHRGTASFAPNFAYALATRRVKPSDLERWDLSCLKVLGCGAEPIQPATMRAFVDLYGEHCDLPRNSIMPAYGMAEATLAITLKPAPDTMHTLVIDADHFAEHGQAIEPTDADGAVVEHVACGYAFDGHEVAIPRRRRTAVGRRDRGGDLPPRSLGDPGLLRQPRGHRPGPTAAGGCAPAISGSCATGTCTSPAASRTSSSSTAATCTPRRSSGPSLRSTGSARATSSPSASPPPPVKSW